MKLLVITQKVDQNDSNLGSFHEWLRRLALQVEKLTVICLQKGSYDLPANVEILTLGKETGQSRLKYLINFYRYIISRRAKYDGVWVHMNQVYIILGGFFWKLWKKPILLWYVHRSVTWQLRLAEKLVDQIFTTSPESFRLPTSKVTYVGHGINTEAFAALPRVGSQSFKLVTVGRISRSKDLVTLIKGVVIAAQSMQPGNIQFTIVGEPILPDDSDYLRELKTLITELKAEKIVIFKGAVTYAELPALLQDQSAFIHASRTGSVDKAVLEPLAAGLPVITSSEAFGLLAEQGIVYSFKEGGALELAGVLKELYSQKHALHESGRAYVAQHHNLNQLIDRIVGYFKQAIFQKKEKYQIGWWWFFIAAFTFRLVLLVASYAASDYNYAVFLNFTKVDGYYELAVNVLQHGIFSLDTTPLLSNSTRTPGYPAFIIPFLAIFHSVWVLLIVQIGIGSCIPLLAQKIAKQAFDFSSRQVYWLGLILVFEPLGALLSTKLLTETLFTFLFLLSLLTMLKALKNNEHTGSLPVQPLVVSAVLLALSALVRPTTVYLPVLFALVWVVCCLFGRYAPQFKKILLFLTAFLLLLAPWVYRNYAIFGVAGFSSIKQEVLFGYLAPSVLTIPRGQNFRTAQETWFKENGINSLPDFNFDTAQDFQNKAVILIKKYPQALIQTAAVSVATFFSHDGLLDVWSSIGIDGPIVAAKSSWKTPWFIFILVMVLVRVFWVIVFLLSCFALIARIFKRQVTPGWGLIGIVIAYFALTTIANGLGVNARFRTPIDALLLITCFDGLCQMQAWWNAKKALK